MNERVKLIRKNAGLTMEQFGERIGMKKSSVSQIESGRNNPSDSSIKMICREFNISEEWLRTGSGAPYKKLSRKEKISEFFGDVLNEGDDDSFKVQVVELLANLEVDDWRYLADMLKRAQEKD